MDIKPNFTQPPHNVVGKRNLKKDTEYFLDTYDPERSKSGKGGKKISVCVGEQAWVTATILGAYVDKMGSEPLFILKACDQEGAVKIYSSKDPYQFIDIQNSVEIKLAEDA